jgi:hypothetical protein
MSRSQRRVWSRSVGPSVCTPRRWRVSWSAPRRWWVSWSDFNLYAELLNFLESTDPALGDDAPPMYAVTARMRREGRWRMMDTLYHPLAIGQPLPTLPVWLKETKAISLVLETSYEEACRTLRIR